MSQVLPTHPITVTPAQIREIHGALKGLYHELNNNITVISGACALGLETPATAKRMLELMDRNLGQPNKIIAQVQAFGKLLEEKLEIRERTEGIGEAITYPVTRSAMAAV